MKSSVLGERRKNDRKFKLNNINPNFKYLGKTKLKKAKQNKTAPAHFLFYVFQEWLAEGL